MSNQALATRPQSNDLRIMIQSDKIREQLAMALPHYYTPDQFTVIVRTAINKNPRLAECDPGSFMTAMITAAQMGLAPDGRHGHLIPRYNGKAQRMECQFQPDYKGLVSLVRKNDNVADVYAETVHEADTFRITKGLHRDLIHEVDVRKSRGAFIGAYAVIAYKDGSSPSFEFMDKEQIDAIKARSQSPNAGPWSTDYTEMAKKTVIKRLLKLADLSQETVERLNADTSLDVAPISTVSEIKTAVIPERPALPEPSAEQDAAAPTQEYPETQPEPERQAEPQSEEPKRGPGRPKKLGKQASEEAPKKAETPAGKVLALIESKGFTKSEFVKAAHLLEIAPALWGNADLDPESFDVADLGDENIELLLDPDNEGQVVEYLTQARGELTK
jgi:recombination protein RecT